MEEEKSSVGTRKDEFWKSRIDLGEAQSKSLHLYACANSKM